MLLFDGAASAVTWRADGVANHSQYYIGYIKGRLCSRAESFDSNSIENAEDYCPAIEEDLMMHSTSSKYEENALDDAVFQRL
jgi:hypothetical protein